MFKGFDKRRQAIAQKERRIMYGFRSIMGKQVGDARRLCIEYGFAPELGQELIALVTMGDLTEQLNTKRFRMAETMVFAKYFSYGSISDELFGKIRQFRKDIEAIRSKYAPEFNALR